MKPNNIILTTGSSHKTCFICKKKHSVRNRLKSLNRKDVLECFKRFNIYIRKDARCCRTHFTKDNLFKIEEIQNCKTLKPNVDTQLESIHQKKPLSDTGFFEKFKDIEKLTEEHCKKITGWSKDEFIKFCSFITSINETDGRTKVELIALYRYWLRKGLDQETICLLFGKNATQQKISHYLCQIRKAIYKDFVPFFLGCDKKRNYFLKHNNKMATKLHGLKNDVLVVVVDGTYCRVEKSANNKFQHSCYSGQKKDHLIKPFIICCADGYIIECYGAFEAFENDASILSLILEKDNKLSQILEPGKTVIFLDRGFRDIYNRLIEEFNFNPKIPVCEQLIEKDEKIEIKSLKTKQLTATQTTESRFVTKCRFIIEKQIGMLKNFKALDNIRNTQVGHIMIDYRIASAMINFTHKPTCPDKNNVDLIVNRMKKRARINSNHLDFLLRKQLDTKDISKIDFDQLEDFPKLNENTIKEKILCGTFHFKQSFSYIEDFLKNGKIFIVNFKKRELSTSNINENSKIIAAEIISRHRRSEKRNRVSESNEVKVEFRNPYKVFVEYIPFKNNSKGIKGYICNCNSGRRVVGCCIHVATVICFLSNIRFTPFKIPALNLQSIFYDKNLKEPPNRPKYIRNKRSKKEKDFPNIQSTISSESDLSENEDSNKVNDQKSDLNGLKINDFREIENEKEIVGERRKELPNQHQQESDNLLTEFISHVPKWSAIINFENRIVEVTNTCSIDYYLFALWYLYKIKPDFLSYFQVVDTLKVEILKEIIQLIEIIDWNRARQLWILNIMNYKISPKENSISMFGSELNRFTRFLSEFQKHQLIQKCKTQCIFNGNRIIKDDSDIIFFKKLKNEIKLYSAFTRNCEKCKKKIECEIKFFNIPSCLYIHSADANILISELPEKITIGDNRFVFLCTTVHDSGHFIGIFKVKNNLYVVDDLGPKVEILKPSILPTNNLKTWNNIKFNRIKTTVSFYVLE